QWTDDIPSSNWYELTYCDTPPEWDVVLQDGTPVRIMKDTDSSGIAGVSYSVADTVCTIGHSGINGEIWPTNEFVFNSASLPRDLGSFLSQVFYYEDGVPYFQPIYLLVGCYDTTGVDYVFVPMWASCDFCIGSGAVIEIIRCPLDGTFMRPCWTRVDCCEPPLVSFASSIAAVPSDLSLRVFPNPFNPSTTISFTLPDRAQTTLEVYNLLGQSVYSVDMGRLEAGQHHHLLDAALLPTGTYLTRLKAGEMQKTKKLLLVK
ncbi:T9SS type A sorting domain-containing protein, partial [bacterium]|nr:T9SS type A sorting domain-containing protein [bacterium]